MLKIPLEPDFNNILTNVSSYHISSQRYATTILASLSLCISIVLYISLINRNCVLLYINTSCYISDIYLLYYWISCNIYVYLCIISSLSFCAENHLDRLYMVNGHMTLS
jgi:hypothetical protein